MKLQNYYLYESNVSSVQKGKQITDLIMNRLQKRLEHKEFVVSLDDLVSILNMISPKDYIFEKHERRSKVGRFVAFGIFEWEDDTITFNIHKETPNYLRRFAKDKQRKFFLDPSKNRFYGELYELLTHELAHREQRQKGETFLSRDNDSNGEYLSRSWELDSFALQAAVEIINRDRSRTWDVYLAHKKNGTITDKVYNKFMKKVTKNIKELHRLGMTK